MNSKIATALKVFLFLSLGIFLVWWIVKDLSQEEITNIKNSFAGANYNWIGLSLIFGILSHIGRALRWNMLLEPMGYRPKLANTFSAVMIGYLVNYAVPRLGEISRCGILNRYDKVPLNKGIGTVIAERGIDLLSLLSIFAITLLLQFFMFREILYNRLAEMADSPGGFFSNPYIFLLLVLIGVGVVVSAYFARHYINSIPVFNRVINIIRGFISGIVSIKNIRNYKLFIFYTFFIWAMYLLAVIVCFYSIPQTAHLGIYAALAVLSFGSVGIIITPGGIGAYQGIVMSVLLLYGVEKSYGFAFGWLIWSAQTILNIVVGVLVMLLLPWMNKNSIISHEHEKEVRIKDSIAQ